MHVIDALERFVLQLEADGRSEHTIGQYRRHVGQLVGWLTTECSWHLGETWIGASRL